MTGSFHSIVVNSSLHIFFIGEFYSPQSLPALKHDQRRCFLGVYHIVTDLLKTAGHSDNAHRELTDDEVSAPALATALHFGDNKRVQPHLEVWLT